MTEQIQEVSQPTQSVQSLPVEPKKKLRLPLIIISLIVISLITLGTIYAVKYFNKPQACTLEARICPDGSSVGRIGPNCEFAPCPTQVSSVSPNPDETASWNIYTNTKYGYQLHYPNNWEIWSVDGSIDYPPLTPTPPPVLGRNILFGYLKRGINGVTDKQEQMYTFVLDNPKQLKLKEYFIDQKWGKEWLEQMEYTTVNNLEAVNLKFSGSPGGYYINIGKYIVNLRFSYTEANDKFDIQPQQTFDQILSTFKFSSGNNVVNEMEYWKTYKYNNISFKYPHNWIPDPPQQSGSGYTQEIKDEGNGMYTFTLTTRGNYNNETGKPYKDLYEFIGMPYEVKEETVDGQNAIQPLPRAGSENTFGVFFFSKDSKDIISFVLNTPNDGSKIQEGQIIFDQILSTFKFLP